jgi:hypothetical protein
VRPQKMLFRFAGRLLCAFGRSDKNRAMDVDV